MTPVRAWVVTFAGLAVNLCLGILYAWSVWKGALVSATAAPSSPMPLDGPNAGWVYLSNPEANSAYMLCGLVFAAAMIPGGRIQAKYGPKFGATLGGLCLAAGCVLAGLAKSYLGLIWGFGVLGGIGMGLGYAAATPAAVKWFGPHRRGLIVGIVVAGYGGAAIYIAPLASWLVATYGLSTSFLVLGGLFAVVIVIAGQLLAFPPAGYIPEGPPQPRAQDAGRAAPQAAADWSPWQMLATWQFYALVFLFFGSAQSGLLVIANATPILKSTATGAFPLLAAHAWLLAAYGGFVNAAGRIGTGQYSDRLGRTNAFLANASVSAVCLLVSPSIMEAKNVPLLFLVLGVAYWQYGGGLALLPAMTADYFGTKNLGVNYGLVFLGWGLGFLISQVASEIQKQTGRLDYAFYLSAGLLITAGVLSRFMRRPEWPQVQD